MNKTEVQTRVLKDGKPLALDQFSWDEETKTFASEVPGLVIDFGTSSYCTFKTGYNCTFDTGSYCTFDTGSGCTFDTGSYCTFKTGYNCTFDTGSYCTFDTGSGCTFDTGSYCTFKTGYGCVIVRRGLFEVIQPAPGATVQLCPSGIPGHLVDGLLDGVHHIIADGILSRIVSQKGDAYKVVNHGETDETWLVKGDGDTWSHGVTLKEATESLVYKCSDRDTSPYKELTGESEVTFPQAVKMYRAITGACEAGVRGFVESQGRKDSYTVSEIATITEGQFGYEAFRKFFNL